MAEEFEWDEANTRHIWRHRVRPHETEEAMLDSSQWPLAAERVGEEEREAVVGATAGGRLLVVIYTMRGERYRVVTARHATPQEARLYWRRL